MAYKTANTTATVQLVALRQLDPDTHALCDTLRQEAGRCWSEIVQAHVAAREQGVWLTEAEVWSAAGMASATQRFDAWGNVIAASGSIPTYGYTGREPDASGLIYYRARYYHPGLGRFISRDPIGLQGGINPYAYADGNPVLFNDPSGLLAKQAAFLRSATVVMSTW